MVRLLLLLFLLLATALPLPAVGGVKARPLSGIGLLAIQAGMNPAPALPPRLTLYREPKIGRLEEFAANRLPGLAPAMTPVDGVWYAIVTASRLGWLRIIYDDAEREGWVERRKSLEFQGWEQFLEGRRIAMLPGIRKDYYLLRSEAALSSGVLQEAGKAGLFTARKIEGDWAYVQTGSNLSGWLRWRDDNGRLLILLNPQ